MPVPPLCVRPAVVMFGSARNQVIYCIHLEILRRMGEKFTFYSSFCSALRARKCIHLLVDKENKILNYLSVFANNLFVKYAVHRYY
jgi:hypothetical protein